MLIINEVLRSLSDVKKLEVSKNYNVHGALEYIIKLFLHIFFSRSILHELCEIIF